MNWSELRMMMTMVLKVWHLIIYFTAILMVKTRVAMFRAIMAISFMEKKIMSF